MKEFVWLGLLTLILVGCGHTRGANRYLADNRPVVMAYYHAGELSRKDALGEIRAMKAQRIEKVYEKIRRVRDVNLRQKMIWTLEQIRIIGTGKVQIAALTDLVKRVPNQSLRNELTDTVARSFFKAETVEQSGVARFGAAPGRQDDVNINKMSYLVVDPGNPHKDAVEIFQVIDKSILSDYDFYDRSVNSERITSTTTVGSSVPGAVLVSPPWSGSQWPSGKKYILELPPGLYIIRSPRGEGRCYDARLGMDMPCQGYWSYIFRLQAGKLMVYLKDKAPVADVSAQIRMNTRFKSFSVYGLPGQTKRELPVGSFLTTRKGRYHWFSPYIARWAVSFSKEHVLGIKLNHVPSDDGLGYVIFHLDPNKLAWAVGLRAGDTIEGIKGHPDLTPENGVNYLREGKILRVRKKGAGRIVDVLLRE